MQTTLLSLAIAIILALVAALVGPFFIDWSSYRAEFETRASGLIGLDFRVTGTIDARLLPTPTLVLHGIELGRGEEPGKVRAHALRIEFALGALVRGELRVADAHLEKPEVTAGIDKFGRLDWPIAKFGFDPEGISIDRFHIEAGRAHLSDAASGSTLVLEELEFRGELRSLAGPIKGEGAFTLAGQHVPFRFSSGRAAEDGGVKLRLAIDPADRPLMAEVDVSVWMDGGMPRYEGGIELARLVGRAPAGAQSLITEPWRVSSRIKGDSSTAVLEQFDFQYGPDDRSIKLRGNAKLTFGARPEIQAALSSPQIDLDRFLGMPETIRRTPMAAVKLLAETFTAAVRVPILTTLSIGVEAITLGGATLARVGADIKGDGERLDIAALEFRAPGMTQVRLSGQLGPAAGGVAFNGSTLLESSDPRALLAWLMHRSDAQIVTSGSLRLSGEIALDNDAVIVERLKLDLDRMLVAGRLAYAWASEDRPARLDAALKSSEIDLDRAYAVTRSVLGEAAIGRPPEGTVSLKIARALVAGTEARDVDVKVSIGTKKLAIEQFAIADLGGAALQVKGHIDTGAISPRGTLTLALDARSLDGALVLMDRISPRAAEELRRSAPRVTPMTLRASLALDQSSGAGGETRAIGKLKVEGRAGTFRIALQGDGNVSSDAVRKDGFRCLGVAEVNLTGRLEADDATVFAELASLDRHIMVERRPVRLAVTAKGPVDGELAITTQLAAGAFNISGNGKIRAFDPDGPSANLDFEAVNARIRSLRPVPAGRTADFLPASMNGKLTLTAGTLNLDDLKGTVAGTSVAGRLSVKLQAPFSFDGDIDLGTADLPALVAAAIGTPAQLSSGSSGVGSGLWPAGPFEQAPYRLNGQLVLRSGRAALMPKLDVRDFRSLLHFGDTELSLQGIEGSVAGGRIGGDLMFERHAEGLTARGRVKLAGANAAELVPGGGVLSGRMSFDVAAEGSGMSAIALIGSLAGNGTFLLENAKLARLDPSAFNVVVRAVDQGLPIDVGRVREKTESALGAGALTIPLAEGAFTINAGQARISSTVLRAQGVDLMLVGNVNLGDGEIDTRLTLSGTGAGTRPEIGITLKGSIEAPKRTTDVVMLTNWLAMRAVEQQAKKLDALEGRALPSQPLPATPDAAVETAQPDMAAGSDSPRAAPSAPQARPLLRSKPRPATSEQAQPLPPPIDIRPAPAPRAAPRSTGAQGTANPSHGRAQTAAPPSRPRSLSEILFGN